MKLTARSTRTLAAVLSVASLGVLTTESRADDSEEEKPHVTNLDRVEALRPDGGGVGMATGIGGGGGRLDILTPAPSLGVTDSAQETDTRDPCGNESQPGTQSAGNPVILYTGNKVETETDFSAAGEMGLYLQRTYNHHWSATGIFGDHWLSNFDYSLVLSDGDDLAWLQRPDGRRLKFLRDPSTGRWYDDRPQPVASIVRETDGSFTHYTEERGIERYDAQGFITQRKNEQGVHWDFTYTGRYLHNVTHSSGRSVQFSWTNGELTQILDPAGNAYNYSYTANVFGGYRPRLASSTAPGLPATTTSYHYEDARYPGGLTGKSINGVRYSTFAYDDQRRAILTEHAGGIERNQFAYQVLAHEQVAAPPLPPRPGSEVGNPDTGWCEYDARLGYVCYEPHIPGAARTSNAILTAASSTNLTRTRALKMSVSVTNPLGRRTTYLYDDGKLISIAGDQSPRCGASYKELSYDDNGLPDILADFQGNLTDYDYDARGRLIKRVEAAGTSSARTTEILWNADNRIVREVMVGTRQSDFTYDSHGNVASRVDRNLSQHGISNQTRTLTSVTTYHANGLTASKKITGPLPTDETTYVYDMQGNLTSVVDALGHTKRYENYNALGLVGRIVGPNGDAIESMYDARGRLTMQRASTGSGWAENTFAYDAAGNLIVQRAADGVVTRLEYDAGRRLTRSVKPVADGTFAWTELRYDNASNIIRKELWNRDFAIDTVVAGNIDGLEHDSNWNWFINGWACTTGSPSSIEVRALVDSGSLLASGTANLSSEAGVNLACQSSTQAHRFRVPITLAQRQQLGGRSVSVYGISPLGPDRDVRLAGSGNHQIPSAQIQGDIGGISKDENWNYFVEGWACSLGVDAPIDVHVYAGGPAGNGSFVTSARADLATDANIANACQARGSAYRFRVPLDENARRAFGGRAIHVHGISPFGGAHLTIGHSGSHAMPTYDKSASMGWGPDRDTILHGESTVIRAFLTNTGNVVWGTDNYFAWGIGASLGNAIHLPHPVRPGEQVELSTTVEPFNHNTFPITVVYVASMASQGVLWGPKPFTILKVLNHESPTCDFGQDCEVIISSLRNAPAAQGAN